MLKRRFIILFIVTISIFALSGCKKSADKVEAVNLKRQSVEKKLVYGSACDYARINPALDEHGEIHKIIFSGLTKYDKNNKLVPDLAENWEYDEENLVYKFNLKNNIKWHDGIKFTANDVKFTIESIKNPKNNSEIATNYEEIKNVEVINENTLKIYLNKPCVPILDYLSVGIIPEHLLKDKDLNNTEFNHKPIGTGPYKIDKWERGQYISLKANENYYGKKPKINDVIFKIIEDEKARALQLKSGELDLAQLEPNDVETFKENNNIKVYRETTADYRGVMLNLRNPIFKDINLRKALSYSIDKQKIVDKILKGMGEKAYSPLQMTSYNNRNVEKYEYNPSKAKSLLDKSGWKIGEDDIREKNGKKLSFSITCFEGDPVRINMATAVCQYFKDINIDAKVEILPQGAIEWEKLEGFLIGWGSPFDPDNHTYKVFHSNKVFTGSNLNKYSNKKVDELLEKARTTSDDDKRKEYYNKFQEEFAQDPAFCMIAYIDAIYGGNSKITGIKEKVLGHHGVGFLWNIEEWDIK